MALDAEAIARVLGSAAGSSPTLEHARLYVGMGFAVLPLHGPVQNENRWVCSCGRSDCGSPAKHPFAKLVANGLKDATKNPLPASLDTCSTTASTRGSPSTRYEPGTGCSAIPRLLTRRS